MDKYKKYLNKPFDLGRHDCFTLIIETYKDLYNVEIPNYARPDSAWTLDYSLLLECLEETGFFLIGDNPRDWQEGDIFLVAIGSKFATHAAIYLGNNKILHSYDDRVSTIDSYRAVWRNNTTARVRHKSQINRKKQYETFNLLQHPNFARLREQAIREGLVDSEGELIGSPEHSKKSSE